MKRRIDWLTWNEHNGKKLELKEGEGLTERKKEKEEKNLATWRLESSNGYGKTDRIIDEEELGIERQSKIDLEKHKEKNLATWRLKSSNKSGKIDKKDRAE